MAIRTAGTEMYTIDPANGSILVVGCVTNIDGIDTTVEQIETTCLEALARSYQAGLATPGTATFGINTDPQDASHVRLHQLKVAGAQLQWAIGWSDATGTPPTPTTNTAGDHVFTLPSNRSWIVFEGFMSSYPFTFALNAVVQSTVGIQISGEPAFIPAET